MKFPDDAPGCLSLTFDIEMCTNFPYWSCVWDHCKGSVDEETRRYVMKLADIAAEHHVPFQWFVLGSSLEEGDLAYLRRLVRDGHALGNHTYRHVCIWAESWEGLQVTYRNNPSLAAGFATPLDAIRHELRTTNAVMQRQFGVTPRGFRSPGGFESGLHNSRSLQELFREEQFAYVSTQYQNHLPVSADSGPLLPKPARNKLTDGVRWSVTHSQPCRYANGLLEIPMMGISDVHAFRNLDLEREEWIRALESGLDLACEQGLVFSVVTHPAVMACRDPHAETVRRLLTRARQNRAWVATNDQIAALFNSH